MLGDFKGRNMGGRTGNQTRTRKRQRLGAQDGNGPRHGLNRARENVADAQTRSRVFGGDTWSEGPRDHRAWGRDDDWERPEQSVFEQPAQARPEPMFQPEIVQPEVAPQFDPWQAWGQPRQMPDRRRKWQDMMRMRKGR